MTPHDDRSPQPEDRLRDIMRSRADEVEPDHDAYTRLAVRVAALEAGGHRAWWRQPQLLALPVAVGLLAVAVGAVALLGGDRGGQRIDTITGPVPPPSAIGPAGPGPLFPHDDPAVWFPSAEEAGRAFVTVVLQDPGLVLEPVADSRIPVRARGEGGTPTAVVGSLLVVEDRAADGSTRFAIAGADVDSIAVDAPPPGSPVTGPLRVSGSASSYEGTVHIAVRAPDGTDLGTTVAQGGAGPAREPFEAEVDLDGSGLAFVVVSTEAVADGATGRHAAVAVEIRDPAASRSYVVIRVRADDPDGGLIVRAAPGTGAAPVGVLPPAATGIRRLGPTRDGWWQVTDGSTEGWVNSAYLALDVPLDGARSDELRGLLADTARAIEARDPALLARLPWDEDRPVLVGWAGDPEEVSAQTLQDPGYWSSTRRFALPEAFDPPMVEATFFDYVDPGRSGGHPIGLEDCCTYGVSDRVEVRGLHHGSVRSGSDADGNWSVTRLYVDWTSGEPRIVAVLVERWEP